MYGFQIMIGFPTFKEAKQFLDKVNYDYYFVNHPSFLKYGDDGELIGPLFSAFISGLAIFYHQDHWNTPFFLHIYGFVKDDSFERHLKIALTH